MWLFFLKISINVLTARANGPRNKKGDVGMNEIMEIDKIMFEILDRYRDAIPRKAFVEVMTRVKAVLLADGITREGGERT